MTAQTEQATTERMGVDPLAVIRAHAESHRSRAEIDAYSAQEAPKLEAAIAAVAELVATATKLVNRPGIAMQCGDDEARLRAALAAFSEAGR